MNHYLRSQQARRWALAFIPGVMVATCLYCCFSAIIAPPTASGVYYAGLFLIVSADIALLHWYGQKYAAADPIIGRRMVYYLTFLIFTLCSAFFLRWDDLCFWETVAAAFITVIALNSYELAALIRWIHVRRLVAARRAERHYRKI